MNLKNFLIYLLIFIATFFMVFYRTIDYAYKTPSRMKNVTLETWDGTKEDFDRIKSNNFFQNFFDLKSHFRIDSTIIDYSNAKSRVIPILVISTFFTYINIKNNLIKYNIGRNGNYEKEKNKLKRKISLITPIFSAIFTTFLVLIALISTNNNFGKYFIFLYDHNDIIKFLMFNNVVVLIVFEFFSFIGLYLLNLFALELVDRYGKIDSILIILIMIWILQILLPGNNIFAQSISSLLPHTMLFLLNGTKILDLILPLFIMSLAIFWIRRLDKNEIEI